MRALWIRTDAWVRAHRTRRQRDVYDGAYARHGPLRWVFRFDVRDRCRRLREVAQELGCQLENARVLDVGFGGGHLLRTFPRSCHLVGAEVSTSAVRTARADPRHLDWASATFVEVPEDDAEALPEGPFDAAVCSHTLEHVPDDRALLLAIRRRLRRLGLLFLFVPIEEPDYNPDHVRNYSLTSVTERVLGAGLQVVRTEGSMHVNGHAWKLIGVPTRRRWPLLGPAVEALRLVSLSAIPYRGRRALDGLLDALGAGPRQGFIVARKPE